MNKYKHLHFDPEDELTLTNFNRTDAELYEFLMFSIAVAGKQAKSTANALDRFMEYGLQTYNTINPYDIVKLKIRIYGNMTQPMLTLCLKQCGFGCNLQRARSFIDICSNSWIDANTLRSIKPNLLEKVIGIGPKTSRFFIMYTRDTSITNENYAAFDTHVWYWLKTQYPDCPNYIPTSSKAYAKWEKKYYEIRDRDFPSMTNSQFDFHIWSTIRKAKKNSN